VQVVEMRGEKMGWWKLEAWKENGEGKDVELNDCDLEHIAEQIKEGFTSGNVCDEEENDRGD